MYKDKVGNVYVEHYPAFQESTIAIGSALASDDPQNYYYEYDYFVPDFKKRHDWLTEKGIYFAIMIEIGPSVPHPEHYYDPDPGHYTTRDIFLQILDDDDAMLYRLIWGG